MQMNNASVKNHFSEEKYNLYKSRAIVYSVFFAITLALCIFLAFKVVNKETIAPVGYKDSAPVDYRVYLKENDFYTEEFLPKGKSYITSLIDHLDINYNYVFNIDDITSMNFEYEVIGNLVIENNNSTKKELFNKEYVIKEKQTKKMNNSGEILINENVQIDYSEYNQLANKFRASYGVDSNSYLKVYLSVKKESDPESKYQLNETLKLSELVIPLTERAIEINIDSKNTEIKNQISGKEETSINYIIVGVIGVLFILTLIFLRVIIKSIIKMKRKRSTYDKYVKKVLKEYDRLVVETKTIMDFSKCNVIKVLEFTELLDVRDNLKVPINYYCIEKHIKGVFYIKSDDDIYALYISSETLEKD